MIAEASTKRFEYSVIRISPDAMRGEWINVGIALFDGERVRVSITHDFSRAECLFHGDTRTLDRIREILAGHEERINSVGYRLFLSKQSAQACIHLSDFAPGLWQDDLQALDDLMDQFC